MQSLLSPLDPVCPVSILDADDELIQLVRSITPDHSELLECNEEDEYREQPISDEEDELIKEFRIKSKEESSTREYEVLMAYREKLSVEDMVKFDEMTHEVVKLDEQGRYEEAKITIENFRDMRSNKILLEILTLAAITASVASVDQ